MTRIAYILDCFPALSETFISQEIRAMEQLGHKVTLISLRKPDGTMPTDADDLAERTHYVPTAISEDETQNILKRYRFKFHRMRTYAKKQTAQTIESLKIQSGVIADIIQAQKCEHIHAHFAWHSAAYAIAASRLLKLPVSMTCHGSDVYARPWDLALKCQQSSHIIAVAPTIHNDLQAIAPNTPCHLVYCGVDTNRFVPVTAPSKKQRRWLFVGRLVDCKGIDDIIKAWALLEADMRPKLDIVGEGMMQDALQKAVHASGLDSDIHFLGGKPSSWIAQHAPHYEAFISAFRQGEDGSRDTSPVALKEAMAMELPIVTTDFIDIPSLVGDKCAMLCPVASPKALSEAVSRMASMPKKERQEMGKAGRKRAEKYFTLQQQATSLNKILGLKAR